MNTPFTPEQTDLLKLPVILTPLVWQEAVHLENPLTVTELGTRLSEVLQCAYHALLLETGEPEIYFGVYRILPKGRRDYRVYLELRLDTVRPYLGSPYLRVSLKEEEPPLWL